MSRLLLFGLAIALVPASFSAAAPGAPAITDIDKVDEDFQYQGEYLGACLIDNYCVRLGLQVVANGNGKFSAVAYRGGLPGYGWPVGGDRWKFAGTREEKVLTLTGDAIQIKIASGCAKFVAVGDYDRNLGSANKVHRQSGTLGACPPCNATVLFNGSSTELFKNGQMTEDGLLKEGTETRDAYGDFRLHLEFRLPYMPTAQGQARANSGVYIQSRYEVQVLDSFGLDGEFNEAGALYRERKPDLNMCLPPLTWQTYDIWFKAARFDADGKKIGNARFTVWLNGVPVQSDIELPTPTGAGKRVGESPKPLPTKLQNHSNPVRFRNIWLVDHSGSSNCRPQSIATSKGQRDAELQPLLTAIGYQR